LRGSGRFRRSMPPPSGGGASFNPLHCGAVVASFKVVNRRGSCRASFNPLHCGAVVASAVEVEFVPAGQGFNPLHCGAVVASSWSSSCGSTGSRVSIPFIAGQWSLLNPWSPSSPRAIVSIPFIAGQWSLQVAKSVSERDLVLVSIPFIAGQWSLHGAAHVAALLEALFQSPSLRGSGRFAALRAFRGAVVW